jgi:uncharacterized membrane protein
MMMKLIKQYTKIPVVIPVVGVLLLASGQIGQFYKTNTQITKELKITPILDKLLEYNRNWIQRVRINRCLVIDYPG